MSCDGNRLRVTAKTKGKFTVKNYHNQIGLVSIAVTFRHFAFTTAIRTATLRDNSRKAGRAQMIWLIISRNRGHLYNCQHIISASRAPASRGRKRCFMGPRFRPDYREKARFTGKNEKKTRDVEILPELSE